MQNKDIKNLSRQEKETLKIKDRELKDRTLRDFKNLFEYEEKEGNYYKPVTVTIMLNTAVTVVELKHY